MLTRYLSIILITLTATFSQAQIQFNNIGTAITQDFNGLSSTTGSWSNNSTITGWYAYETDPYGAFTEVTADDGSSNSGKLYSYGSASQSDRALGAVCSGSTETIAYGAHFINKTGQQIMAFAISYTGEQWRDAGNSAQSIEFYYKKGTSIGGLTATEINNKTFMTEEKDLHFTSPQFQSGGALNGNASANRMTITDTLFAIVAEGEEIMIAWIDENHSGSDHGLAIDDFSITPLTSGSATPPEIEFKTSDISVKESGGSVTVEVTIQNPSNNPTSVEVALTGGTAIQTTDFKVGLPIELNFPPHSNQEQSFQIEIVDNEMVNTDKSIVLELQNATNNATFGFKNILTITIENDDFSITDISNLTTIDGDLRPTFKGTAKVRGVVYGMNMRSSGVQFTLIDGTDGINVVSFDQDFGYAVQEGDDITVQGPVSFYNGLTQIGTRLDTIILNNTDQQLKSPRVVTVLDESTESDLVQIERLTFVDPSITEWPDNGNVLLHNGTDTITIRIDGDVSDLAGAAIPTYDTMTITGIGGQFDNSAPYDEGYQLFPRYEQDIVEYGSTTASVNELEANLSLYPNPASKTLTVKGLQQKFELTIIDLSGKVILEKEVNTNTNDLDISTLESGMYWVRVSRNNQTATRKLLVQ
jgi:hypothetical protein